MPSKIKITFLGTSAQIPTVKRNHSAILLNYNKENILIDCGEGTQRQFRKAKLNPCKITRILITHKHGDHTFGIPGILSTLALNEYNKTLYIYGPKGTKRIVEGLLDLFRIKRDYKIEIKEITSYEKPFFETKDFYLEAERMEHGTPSNAYNFVIKDKSRIDKKKLKKAKIPHGKHLADLSSGKNIKIKGKTYKAKDFLYKEPGKKISFVLDTAMNERIVPFVKNSNLLICESSFSDELREQAKEYHHMTAKLAGEVAKKSKSQKLILTHISQRYEIKLKELLEEAKENFKEAKIAHDFDEIEI